MEKLDQYLSSPLVNAVGLAVGILGIGLAYIFYLKGKKDKEPSWAIQTVNLIRDYSVGLSGLEVIYMGEKVKNLSISKLMFWNHGSLTIDRSDIADADPLGIFAKEGSRLLDVKLLAQNNPASRVLVSTSPDKSNAQFVFDYLDRGQGFVVQIIHEGISSTDVNLRGSIKGARAFVRIDPSGLLYKTRSDRTMEILQRVFVLFIFLAVSTFVLWIVLTQTGGWGLKLALGCFAAVLLLVSLGGISRTWKLLRLQGPKGLDVFYDDPRQGLIKPN